jgi:hypothetical protein
MIAKMIARPTSEKKMIARENDSQADFEETVRHFGSESRARYLKKAMIRGDAAFLSHLQLRTLDEETIAGANVTLEFIDQLLLPNRFLSNIDSRIPAIQLTKCLLTCRVPLCMRCLPNMTSI